jgi:hypothetical protein
MEAAMGWKLYTRDESTRPNIEDGSTEYDSKDRALERACDIIRQNRHVKVRHIEEPNGQRIEITEIEAWCKSPFPKKIPEQ